MAQGGALQIPATNQCCKTWANKQCDGCSAHLVAEDGEALLEGELEPIAAGDAVAGPVVEVLVAHHTLHARVVHVRRRGRRRNDQAAVEDVERLVLHRAHIEVVHRHYVEQVQIVLQAWTAARLSQPPISMQRQS